MTTARIDRAAAVRGAVVRLVAERGFHGASMGAVAKEAGVATGTAYVHYASKEELVHATYLDVKRSLMEAAASAVDPESSPREQFEQMWRAAYDHLAEDPRRARFLAQVDSSPFAAAAHERSLAAGGDPVMAVLEAAQLVEAFTPLPLRVLYDLALGPVLRLVAAGEELEPSHLPLLVEACWRAVTPGG